MFLLLVSLISSAFAWDIKLHQAILYNALTTLPSYIRDDLQLRLSFFDDMSLDENPTSISIIPDLLRVHKFYFLSNYHFTVAFAPNPYKILYTHENRLYAILFTLNNYLLNDKRFIFFDTFALTYIIHISGDLFQPLHTLSENGLGIKVEGYKNLHTYWDHACGYFNNKSYEEIGKELQTIEKDEYFTIDNLKIELKDINEFKTNKDIKKIFEMLLKLYNTKVQKELDFKTLNDRLLINAILDVSEVQSEKYKKFCWFVSLQNMVYSSLFLRNLLKEIYTNLKPSLDAKQTDFLIKMNIMNNKTINYNIISQVMIIVLLLINIFIFGILFFQYRKGSLASL